MTSIRSLASILLATAVTAPQALLAQTGGGTGGGTGTPGGTGGGTGTPGGTGGGSGTPGGTGAGTDGQGVTLVNPLKVDNLRDLLNLVLEAVVDIGTIILVLALVWVGFLFVAARGNEEKLRNARAAFFWTIIGGLILLGAQGIATVIESTATNLGS